MEALTTEFYKNLFGPAEGYVWVVHAKIFEENTRELSRFFSEDEIKSVMKTNRAGGVVGFSIEFFQTCCPFIKGEDDVMMCLV